jgi:hypothetical protein
MPATKTVRRATATLLVGAAAVAAMAVASPAGATEQPQKPVARFDVELYVEQMSFTPSATDTL